MKTLLWIPVACKQLSVLGEKNNLCLRFFSPSFSAC